MADITVNIKCSNADKATVTIERTATILELKTKIGEALSVPADQQRLIYKGRVLKDDLTVEQYDIQDGHTVHMVKGAGAAAAAAAVAASSTPASSSTQQPLPANNNNPLPNPFANPFGAALGGPRSGTGSNDLNRMQQQFMQNPEIMQQVMNSPMMDNLLNNPDLFRNMMVNNPQIQAMMDANPQIRHMLNDPAILRQSMEMMRNPNAMREAMRSQELAMSQLENLPGGYQAMRRMFEDVQEPLMEAQMSQNTNTNTVNNTASAGVNSTNTAPTNSAVPNPWGNNNINNTANPFAPGLGGVGLGGAGLGGADPFGLGAGLGGAGADPAMMAAMMQNPYMQQMMQQMLNDPATINQLSAMNPQLGVALQNPQVRAMLTNPASLQAMLQMQQAMGGAGGAAGFNPYGAAFPTFPPASGGVGVPRPIFNPFAIPTTATATNPALQGLDFSSLLATNNTNNSSAVNTPAFAATVPSIPQQNPRERFAAQLQQLQDMGFADEEANLRALQATHGNVNNAVERLLNGI